MKRKGNKRDFDLPSDIEIAKQLSALSFPFFHTHQRRQIFTMATTRIDTRNLEWKNNNVGSKLLAAMGWKDGMAVGKRARTTSTAPMNGNNVNVVGDGAMNDAVATASNSTVGNDDAELQSTLAGQHSTEGLRIVKRKDGLGIGADSFPLREASSRHNHVADFATVLSSLQHHHSNNSNDDDSTTKKQKKDKKKVKKSKKESKKTKRKEVIASSTTTTAKPAGTKSSTTGIRSVATNRMTNNRVRRAKFAMKSDDDMRCIFAGATTATTAKVSVPDDNSNVQSLSDKKRKKKRKLNEGD